jgi:hypothetical protein
MSDTRNLTLDVVDLCADDYESLEQIRDGLDEPVPEDGKILAGLRDAAARGWIICYRHELERVAPDPGPEATPEEKQKQWRSTYVPLAEFEDRQAGELWWMATREGLKAVARR